MYKRLQDGEREVKEISSDSNVKIKMDYLDIFEGVISDIMYTAQYDENIDIVTAYLIV